MRPSRWALAHILVLSSIFFIFLVFSVVADCMSTNFHTWCGLSTNLRCRFERCCTWLAENTVGLRKMCKKVATSAPSHKFVGLYLRNEGTYRQSEKNFLNSDVSPTCSHNMVNFGLLSAEIGSLVWGTSAYFKGFRVLASLPQRRRSTESNQTLHDVTMYGN